MNSRKAKLCCENCFDDDFLKEHIKDNNQIGNCDYCESKNVNCIEPSELGELFLPIFNLYTPIIEFMGIEEMKSRDFISNKIFLDFLNHEWGIFADLILENENDNNLTEDIMTDVLDDEVDKLELFIEDQKEWAGNASSSFNYNNLWSKIEKSLKYGNRFFLSEEYIDILEALKEVLVTCRKTITSDDVFYRARISKKNEKGKWKKYSCGEEMTAPKNKDAKFGRGNPTGIRYLNLSTDENTVVSEVRPEQGQRLTIGVFHLKRDIVVVDLTSIRTSPFEYGESLEQYHRYIILLLKLNQSLNKPVTTDISEIEYVTSQYFCEFIKHLGIYDGIMFDSRRGTGKNLFGFNPDDFECYETYLCKVTSINYGTTRAFMQ